MIPVVFRGSGSSHGEHEYAPSQPPVDIGTLRAAYSRLCPSSEPTISGLGPMWGKLGRGCAGNFGPVSIPDVQPGTALPLNLQVVVDCISRPYCGTRPTFQIVGPSILPYRIATSAVRDSVRPNTEDGAFGDLVADSSSVVQDLLYEYAAFVRAAAWTVGQGICVDTLRVFSIPGFGFNTAYSDTSSDLYGHPCHTLFVAGEYNAYQDHPDTYNDAEIRHEYGHFVARALQCAADTGESHSLNKPIVSASGLKREDTAFEEGWADFFSCAINGSSQFIVRGWNSRPVDLSQSDNSVTYDLETGTVVSRPADPTLDGTYGTNGEGWECATAGELWDLLDTGIDQENPSCAPDSFTTSFSQIRSGVQGLAIIAGGASLCAFNLRFMGAISSQPSLNEMFSVFCAHGGWPCSAVTTDVGRDATVDLRLIRVVNPAAGELDIVGDVVGRMSPSIELFDVLGRRVDVGGSLSRRTANGAWVWRPSNSLRSGFYVVRVIYEARHVERRVVYVR